MIKKENKYQIAQEKQREKYKKSLDSFNAYVHFADIISQMFAIKIALQNGLMDT